MQTIVLGGFDNVLLPTALALNFELGFWHMTYPYLQMPSPTRRYEIMRALVACGFFEGVFCINTYVLETT